MMLRTEEFNEFVILTGSEIKAFEVMGIASSFYRQTTSLSYTEILKTAKEKISVGISIDALKNELILHYRIY